MRGRELGGIVGEQEIINNIHLIRGEKVMLDRDLAAMYGVETKQLKRQVKRNSDRFPSDFMFQLTSREFDSLRSQSGTSKRGGTRYPPMAFTEQGVAMLSSVLNSKTAIEVNIRIIRVFTRMRGIASAHKDIIAQLAGLEKDMISNSHAAQRNRQDIENIFIVLKQLIEKKPVTTTRNRMGFKRNSED